MTHDGIVPAGIVVVDKPSGWTSHDVVARMRRLAGTRRVGHAGTLDPMATGVLVVGIGRATRLLGYLAGHEKAYDATIRLGVTTTTDDAEGSVVATADASGVSDAALAAALGALTGHISQVPSAVSAIKVGGKRAYARARAGESVELSARPVTVRELRVLDRRGDDVDVHVLCSAGTYVRAIARDLGATLGVGAHLTALRRVRSGPFTVDKARTLDQLAECLDVEPLGLVARKAFPVLEIDAEQAVALGHGKALGVTLGSAGQDGAGPYAAIGPDGDLVALVEDRGGAARPIAVFQPR